MAKLSGADIGEFQQTLLSAFNRRELEQLLLFRLNRRLEDLTGPDDAMPDVMLRVITKAERDGWTAELLRAAAEARPNRPEVQTVTARLLVKLDAGEAAGELLPELQTQPFEPLTVPVPAGAFLMGSAPGPDIPEAETPFHETPALSAYYIGKYPVTNDQYRAFLEDQKRLATPEMRWSGQSPPRGKGNYPVSGITWYDALAYCRWLEEKTGRNYTLPDEAQWEKAARGADGRVYPWGDEWDPGACHHDLADAAPVDAYPAQGVYGCFDLVGNVREWTRALWGADPVAPDERCRYPWRDDGRNNLEASSAIRRVYRGGASERTSQMRCAYRASYDPRQPGPFGKRHGFRVVLIPKP